MEKIKDIRVKTDDELDTKVKELKKESLNLRFQQASGQLKNTARFNQIKKEVARIKTVQTERKNSKKGA
ncbi:MAG: 50S ribosomal protein L29 [Alphaproteobacteria bacterium]|nr:50S ribosomal protein L29 [Alphaproteobacteria bacterium]NCB49998.1 50S ribosomal protein L29 [Alphaproteobacteria bacterium]